MTLHFSSDDSFSDVAINETLTHEEFTLLEKFFVLLNGLSYLLILPLILFWPIKSVEQYQKGFFFRFGKSKTGADPLDAGLCFCLPCDNLVRIDMRQRTWDIPAQNLLTGDSVTVTVDGIVFWRVTDAWKALIDAEDYERATALAASTALRNTLSSKTLYEVLSDRISIADEVCASVRNQAKQWGVVVTSVQINDVRLPSQLQRVMAAEAEATREAAAKVAAAHGELESSVLIAQAALELESGGPNALKVRYLNAITEIASNTSNTILFPIPSIATSPHAHPSEKPSEIRKVAMMRAAAVTSTSESTRNKKMPV